MIRRGWILALTVLIAPTAIGAQPTDLDAQRSAWQYRRAVTVAAGSPSADFTAVVIPPEVAVRSQRGLQDLRLLEASGREVPYVVDRAVERHTTTRWSGQLIDTRRDASRTVWVVDLGESRTFDRLVLDIRDSDFAKRIRVERSGDAQQWHLVKDDVGIFDRPWTTRVNHTTITLAEPAIARYLRLTADDRRSAPVDMQGLEAMASRRVSGVEWRRAVALSAIASPPGVSRYRLDLPSRHPLETLELAADEPAFSRRAVLVEVRGAGGRREEVRVGDAVLYRLKVDDRALAGEMLALRVQRPVEGELILEIHDGDSPPLRGLRASVAGTAPRLLFLAAPGPLTLYYGNDATRAPLYDLESLRGLLGIGQLFAVGSLGSEMMNPRFQRMAPLPFAAPRGAAIQVTQWPEVRQFVVEGREDIYSLTLAPEDVARAGAAFADLRIVDESDRQLPYVLEPTVLDARSALTVERQRAPNRATSRYRLTFSSQGSTTLLAPPFSALELTFPEEFFSRPVRVLAPPQAGSDRERTLVSGTLTRGGATRVGSSDGPILLGLSGTPERELFLEIDEGDNAPLTLQGARGVLRVPRVTFKAAPGRYRVLLGNRAAEPPRYDIASLRQDVLSFSAVPIQAGPSEANPAFRRQAGDLVRIVSPTVVLWGTLAVAVVVLLIFTLRLLKTGAPPGGGS